MITREDMQTAALTNLVPKHPPVLALEPGADDRTDGACVLPISVCSAERQDGANAEPGRAGPPVPYNPLATALTVPRLQFRDPERARELSRAKAVLVHIRNGYRAEEFANEITYALGRGLITQTEVDQASCISGEKRARAAVRAVRYGGNPAEPRLQKMLTEGVAAGLINPELINEAVNFAQRRGLCFWT
ncbi:MAG: hypothetical protein H7Z43_05605 [Clostridia bacterium]|nr:hypothetical protein [Deltaproteobacteria bacterium]